MKKMYLLCDRLISFERFVKYGNNSEYWLNRKGINSEFEDWALLLTFNSTAEVYVLIL